MYKELTFIHNVHIISLSISLRPPFYLFVFSNNSDDFMAINFAWLFGRKTFARYMSKKHLTACAKEGLYMCDFARNGKMHYYFG